MISVTLLLWVVLEVQKTYFYLVELLLETFQ